MFSPPSIYQPNDAYFFRQDRVKMGKQTNENSQARKEDYDNLTEQKSDDPELVDRASKTVLSGRRIVHGYVNRSLYITICALQLIILLS